jgi:hypothetical protein
VCVASKRASHSRTCRAEPYRQHAHAIARAYMGDTTTESLTYIISQASTSIYVYINIYLTCASRYTGGHTHTHKMSPAASSARAIAHTCTWRRCIHMHTRTKCHRPHRRHAQSHTRGHGGDASTCALAAYPSQKYTAIYCVSHR